MTEAAALTRVLVIIPTFNEAQNIEAIIARLRKSVPQAHILVVDDQSPDGTGELADSLAEQDDHVHQPTVSLIGKRLFQTNTKCMCCLLYRNYIKLLSVFLQQATKIH